MLNLTLIRSVNLDEKQWPNQLNVQIFYLYQIKCGLRSFTLELSSADYEHLKPALQERLPQLLSWCFLELKQFLTLEYPSIIIIYVV